MKENITAPSNVIPFRFETREVRTMLLDGQPWFVATDVCASLAIGNVSLAVNGRADREADGLDEDDKGIATVNTPSGDQKMLVVSESGLYSLIFKSRKAEAKRFKKWVTSEVLPAIRRTGQYYDSSNKMATLVDALIGMTEVNVLKGLIRDKAKVVSTDKRRSFQQTMHNRLHTRFNVPRLELIPAQQFEAACNFVAAYALEGEWLPESAGKSSAIPRPILKGQRWMVFVDDDGVERATEIPSDASVLSFDQFLKSMLIDCDMPVSTDEMFRFASLAMNNLQRRSQVCNAQLRAARSR